MQWVLLIFILGHLVLEGGVDGNLVGLVNNEAMTSSHTAHMHRLYPGDVGYVFVESVDQALLGILHIRLGPEDNYVRKHPHQSRGSACGGANLF